MDCYRCTVLRLLPRHLLVITSENLPKIVAVTYFVTSSEGQSEYGIDPNAL